MVLQENRNKIVKKTVRPFPRPTGMRIRHFQKDFRQNFKLTQVYNYSVVLIIGEYPLGNINKF